MAKFILIDHSIEGVGGHHYEYALHVLQAAEKEGYTPILATNRRFKKDESIEWKTHSVYKYGFWLRLKEHPLAQLVIRAFVFIRKKMVLFKIQVLFSPAGPLLTGREYYGEKKRRNVIVRLLRWLKGLSLACAPRMKGVFRSIGIVLQRLYERRRVWQFGRDTIRLFRRVFLQEGDIVFIPTLSIGDMAGLLKYFRKDERSKVPTWHLLFRRNLYTEREREYSQQDKNLGAVRNAFLQFQTFLTKQRVYFYTDTEELTAQYNRLGAVQFKTLPIPHTCRTTLGERSVERPLRIIYVGDARSEKGYQHLPRIVQDLWTDYVKTGKVVFVIQSNYSIPAGDEESIVARSQLENYPDDKVKLLKQALSSEEYWQLLSSGDINLLLYHPDNYSARSSGILIESLALGVPVIVPTGTWLARQFVDEIYRYHESLKEHMKILTSRRNKELKWHRHGQPRLNPMLDVGLFFGGENSKAFCWVEVPKGAMYLLVSFRIVTPASFVMVYVNQWDSLSRVNEPNTFKAEKGLENEHTSILVPLQNNVKKIWLGFCNAFVDSTTALSDITVEFLSFLGFAERCPMSAVGLMYSHSDEISYLLREMIDNYPHYRKTAQDFAIKIFGKHNAARLVRELEHSSGAFPERDTHEPPLPFLENHVSRKV